MAASAFQYINLRIKNLNNTKGILQLIILKSKSKVHLNIVKVKGKDIMNHREIANAFTNFLTDISPNPSKTIPNSSKQFKIFFKNSSLNSFLLKPTSEDEVHKPISQLNKGKVLGPSCPLSIPVIILKDNVNIFPECLKYAHGTLVNKKKTLPLLLTTAL